MTDDSELSQLIRDALPARRAPAALHEWAHARARQGADADTDAGVYEIGRHSARARVGRRTHMSRYAAGLLLAVGLGVGGGVVGHSLASRSSTSMTMQQALGTQLVDAHITSLMGEHLMDVRSSDQHTVKPWFAGRTDFAPRVVALDSVGFPLLGGRIASVHGHDAAVLVYGRRKHVINLFMWPEEQASAGPAKRMLTTQRGYALAHWTSNGVSYWAVSDAAPAELEAFRAAYMGGSID
jgi:anti-sigma factor RsiW